MHAHRVALSGPQGGIYSLVASPAGSHIPSVFPLAVTRSPIFPSQYFRHHAAVQVLLICRPRTEMADDILCVFEVMVTQYYERSVEARLVRSSLVVFSRSLPIR